MPRESPTATHFPSFPENELFARCRRPTGEFCGSVSRGIQRRRTTSLSRSSQKFSKTFCLDAGRTDVLLLQEGTGSRCRKWMRSEFGNEPIKFSIGEHRN